MQPFSVDASLPPAVGGGGGRSLRSRDMQGRGFTDGLPSYLFRNENQEAHVEGGSSPFLNEWSFACRRVAETCFGGLRFPLTDQEFTEMGYIHAIQLGLLATPYAIATAIDAVSDDGGLLPSVAFAVTLFCTGLLLRALGSLAQIRAGESFVVKGSIGDEEEFDFEGCMHASTYAFVCAQQHGWGGTLANAMASAGVCFVAYPCLGWNSLATLFGASIGRALIHICGWVAVCFALYCLTVHEAVEPNAHAIRCGGLSRAFHVVAALLPVLMSREGAFVLSAWTESFLLVTSATLPVWWALGILPPLDAAVCWAVEQLVVHFHGASAAATPIRLLFSLAGCWATVMIAWSICETSVPAALAVASFISALLSQDLLPAVRFVSSRSAVASSKPACLSLAVRSAVGASPAFIFVICCSANTTLVEADANKLSFALALFAVRLMAWAVSQVQRPFLANVVRNCSYNSATSNGRLFSLYSTLLGFLRVGLSVYLLFVLRQDALRQWPQAAPPLLWCAAATRALRIAWQRPGDAAVEVAIVALLLTRGDEGNEESSLGGDVVALRSGLNYPVQLFIYGLMWSRLREFVSKLIFMTVILVTSWTSKGQRNSFKPFIHVVLTAAYPLWIGVASVAAAFSAPLVPLLGAPCFSVGYPRPRWHDAPTTRSWHSLSGSHDVDEVTNPLGSADQAIYKQLLPSLCAQFEAAYCRGVPGEINAGEHFVARYEDMVAWISVLESGFGYHVLCVQGLELQVTSCHNVEGLRMDQVLAPATSHDEEGGGCLTQWPGHLLQPLCTMNVLAYSNSPTILTGIIDSKENLLTLQSLVHIALVWCFSSEGATLEGSKVSTLLSGIHLNQKASEIAKSRFPREWAEYVELYKADLHDSEVFIRGQFAGQSLEQLVTVGCVLATQNGIHAKDVVAFFVGNGAGPRNIPLALQDVTVPDLLRTIVVRAFRLGFKLMYDAAVGLLNPDNLSELHEVLQECQSSWHIVALDDPEWNRHMLAATPNLLTVGTSSGSGVDQGEGPSEGSEVCIARLLQCREVEVVLGQLNGEAVNGLWASLSHELTYLANDDDERYSIQANPALLRNMTMQAAATPLGYAAFSSPAISVDSSSWRSQMTGPNTVATKSSLASNLENAPSMDHSAQKVQNQPPSNGATLPYGGDVQAAMKAADRSAIRLIIASRDNAPPPTPMPIDPAINVSERVAHKCSVTPSTAESLHTPHLRHVNVARSSADEVSLQDARSRENLTALHLPALEEFASDDELLFEEFL